MQNKKGAEMTIGTIVIIILALVVLAVIVYGFSTGWSNLWENIISFGGGKVNVQTVVTSCKVACTSESNYDYCLRKRTISFEGDDTKIKSVRATCSELEKKTADVSGVSVALPATDLQCTSMTCA